jgi:small-conductance mechanosensitive channel
LERLNEIHKEIEAVRQHSGVVLLALDSPPLWTLLFGAEAIHSIAAQTSESAAKFYQEAVNFFQLDQKRLLVHLVQFLVILGLFYRLRYLAQIAGDIKPTAAERFVLERSFSSALLVSLFTVPLFYVSPNILRLAMIPVVIPILRLLPAILSPRLRMGFYFLTVIYWLDLLHYYLPPQWLLGRLLLMAVAVLGIVDIGLILKTWKSGPTASQHSAGAIRSLLHIAMALFVGAIIANVVGNLSLAELLVSPLVRILYVGVVIRMGAVTATTYAVMALRAPLALVLRTVRERGEAVALSLRRLVNFVAATLWILIGLLNVGALEDVQIALKDFLQLQWKVGAAEISVGDFAIFILVLCAAYVLSRLLRFVLAEEIFPRFQMPRGVPDVLELVARYGVLLFGFLLALTSAGVNLSQVTLAISALGVGIGFGLQNIVNNFVCGLILVFEHPIQVGDFVEVGSHFGKVQRIGFRASVVRTLDGAEVIVPNAELIGTKVINWSLSDRLRRVTVHVPVPIGTDPDRVIDILEAVGRSQSDVVSHPAPSAALEQFGDSSLKFELRCWTRCEGFGSVGNALTLAIDKAFQKEGIQIPFPQANVHVHWSDEMTRGDRSTDTKK